MSRLLLPILVAVAALAPPATAHLPAGQAGGTFRGTTSQGLPVKVVVDRSSRLAEFTVDRRSRCFRTIGGAPERPRSTGALRVLVEDLAVRRDGRIAHLKSASGFEDETREVFFSFSERVNAHFSGPRVSGTFRLTSRTVQNGEDDRCTTGLIRWSARRG